MKKYLLTACLITQLTFSTVENLVKAIQAKDSAKIAALIKKDPSIVNQTYSPPQQTKVGSLQEIYASLSKTLDEPRYTTPLFYAVATNDSAIVKQLLDAGASPKFQTNYKSTPLHEAFKNENISPEIIKNLVEKGAPLIQEDAYGAIPLLSAAESSPPELLELILRQKPDLSIKNWKGETALHRAAYSSKPYAHKNVQRLIKYGADILAQNNEGKTPVQAAFRSDVEQLLKEELRKKKFPILYAFFISDQAVIDAAERNPVNILESDEYESNALTAAISRNNIRLLQELFAIIEKKLPHQKQSALNYTQQSESLLHLALRNDFLEGLTFLLTKGTNPNLQDHNGNTVLHIAAQKGDTKIIKMLLQAGANPAITNKKGETALHSARNGTLKEWRLLLEKLPSLINMTDNEGNTLLHHIAPNDNIRQIQFLLDHGADPAIRNNKRKRPQDLVDKGEEAYVLLAQHSPLATRIQNLSISLAVLSKQILA